MKRALLACAAGSAVISGPLVAEAGSSPTPANSDETSASVQEVIVTAQMRSESLQKTALPISAIGGRTLENQGVAKATDLNGLVAGLKIGASGPQTQTFIRGVGDLSANNLSQPGVALNMDGVYIGRPASFSGFFYDLSRIEVLKGPQGTLYGRNASGGAINIISNAPGDTFGGYIVSEVGNYNLLQTEGAINLPIGDHLALRVAGQITRRDGYLSDGSDDDKSEAVRAQLRWKPTDQIRVDFRADYSHQGGNNAARVFYPYPNPSNPWTGPDDSQYINPARYPRLLERQPSFIDMPNAGFTVEVNDDLNFATLTAIAAVRRMDMVGVTNGDYLLRNDDAFTQRSVEVRLANATDKFKWVVGLYYYAEDGSIHQTVDQRALDPQAAGAAGKSPAGGDVIDTILPQYNTLTGAAFGEGTYSVTTRFRLTGGLRYTADEKTMAGVSDEVLYTNTGAAIPGNSLNLSFAPTSATFGATTWKGGLEYDLLPRSMLYFSASRGFKSGGLQPIIEPNTKYDPEYLIAYELGLKNQFFGGRLQLNLEAFRWDYTNKQESFLTLDSRGTSTFITENAGQATIQGFDADTVWKPSPNGTLRLDVEYLDARYDKFLFASPAAAVIGGIGTVQSSGCLNAGPTTPVAGHPLALVDCSGHQLPRAPTLSVDGSYEHIIDLPWGGQLIPRGSFSYSDKYILAAAQFLNPNFTQKAYVLLNANLTYRPPQGRWSIDGWVRNITNTAVFYSANTQTSIVSAPATALAAINNPRTFGATLRFDF